jgi:hypothetical protein
MRSYTALSIANLASMRKDSALILDTRHDVLM